MQFMMLMIPNGYRDNKMDAGFVPDPKKWRRWAALMKSWARPSKSCR